MSAMQPPIDPALVLVRQLSQQPQSPPPKLTPEQQAQLLFALVQDVHALRQELARVQKILLLVLGISIGTFGAEKIISILGV